MDNTNSGVCKLCKGSNTALREEAYCESSGAIALLNYTDYARTVRTKQYRYTYYAGNSGEQLFDLINDPNETVNISQNPEFKEIKNELRLKLLELVISQEWPKTR